MTMTPTMEFDCKLAHQDDVKKVANFNSTKELYYRIGERFSIPVDEILYCTLNTHNFRDVNSILGNFLSHGDLIVAHICGQEREINLKKSQEFLGLTLTDNANGRAFIKKVNSDDSTVQEEIKPGDHISAINSESTVGQRHYEVAKAIRALPQNITFSLRLIVPRYSDRFLDLDTIDSHQSITLPCYNKKETDIRSINRHDLSNSIVSLNSTCDELINSSLPMDKLLSKQSNHIVDESKNSNLELCDDYKMKIDRLNSLLESFLGIHDNLLAIQIYRLAKENQHSFVDFSIALKTSELRIFSFDDEMKAHLWKSAREMVTKLHGK